MNFIKIGDRFINLDKVNDVQITSKWVKVFYSFEVNGEQYTDIFTDLQAQALAKYFTEISNDLMLNLDEPAEPAKGLSLEVKPGDWDNEVEIIIKYPSGKIFYQRTINQDLFTREMVANPAEEIPS